MCASAHSPAMPDAPRLRPATPDDAQAITDIYNVFVAGCTSTWQTEPEAVEKRRAWLSGRRPEHPVFVAELDGRVVGFGSLSPYSDRGGFRETAEISLYLAESAQGRGLGTRLMNALLDSARDTGVLHLVLARISGDRTASLALHAKAGFTDCGRIPEAGLKFGRRLDLVHMARRVR